MSDRKVPVYVHADGADVMIQRLPEAEVLLLIEIRRVRPIYGRRGHLKRVVMIARLTGLIHLERDGLCFRQRLPNVGRRVFALVGTPGTS